MTGYIQLFQIERLQIKGIMHKENDWYQYTTLISCSKKAQVNLNSTSADNLS